MKMLLLTALLAAASTAFALDRGEEIKLWPNGAAPGSEGVTAAEISEPSDKWKWPRRFTLVHYPSIYAFLPAKALANGAAVLVIPGGGHSQLVIEKEGWEIAEWFNNHGVAAFVLKHRLARAPGSKYTVPEHALADTARAMRHVRSRAAEWSLDPARIGVIGFSAGGELAALIETRFSAGDPGSADPVERVSSRPDFAVVIYPGFRPGVVTVPADAPPTFLGCSDDDRSHVVTTVNLYLDLQKQKVPSEMHIYATGGHGWAMRPSNKPVDSWPDRLREWLVERGVLRPVPVAAPAQAVSSGGR